MTAKSINRINSGTPELLKCPKSVSRGYKVPLLPCGTSSEGGWILDMDYSKIGDGE